MNPSLLLFAGIVTFCMVALSAKAAYMVTEDSVVVMAQKNHPDLKAVRLLIDQAEAQAQSTGRLSNPELELEVGGAITAEGRVAAGIMQRFPMTARLRIEKVLSELAIKQARLEVAEYERQVVMTVRLAFYELAMAQNALRIIRHQKQVADDFAKSVEQAVAQGFHAPLDAQQARLTAETLLTKEVEWEGEQALANSQLATLLGLSADTEISIKKIPSLPSNLPAKKSLGYRPDLQQAKLAIQYGIHDVSLAKASRWEDVGVGVFAEGDRFEDAPEGIQPEALIGVRLSIPLPLWQNGSGKVTEKEKVRDQREQQYAALRLSIQNEVFSKYLVLEMRYKVAAQMRDRLLPSAQKQMREAEAAFGKAEADSQTVFQVQERLIEIELASLEAQKNYFIALAQWLGAVGQPIQNP